MEWMARLVFLVLFVSTFTAAKNEDFGTVIGIDLGTTYSCVGVFRNGRVEIIPNDQGKRITPSYVAFTGEGKRLIGDLAENQATSNPENTIFDTKRLIGRNWSDPAVEKDMKFYPFQLVNENDKPFIIVKTKRLMLFAPEEISAMVLSKLKENAEKYLGEKITHAVVTGTAFFNDAQRQATKDAGIIAGLNILRVINEPTAAAIAYGFDKVKDERNILVFDFGGGTFDVSVLTVDKGVFEVRATTGSTNLGGEDLNHRVMGYLIQLYKKQTGYDISNDNGAVQKLRREVERAKRTLSYEYQTKLEIDLFYRGGDYSQTLTRAKFDELNMNLYLSTIAMIQKVLNDCKFEKKDIDEIVLVGGSTRIPKIRELVKQFFNGKKLAHGINPDEAVAYGAAIHAGVLSGERGTSELVLLDVNPISLGLSSANGTMVKMIPKYSVIPFEKSQVFGTKEDNQESVAVEVYQGEHEVAKKNQHLGSYQFSGIPPAPHGLAWVKVTFILDINGILNVTVKDTKVGEIGQITITNVNNRLTEQDIERMKTKAGRFTKADKIAKELSEARNDFESSVYALKNEIANEEKVQGTLSESEKRIAKSVIEDKIEWLEQNENPKIEDIINEKEEFDYVVAPIISKLHAAAWRSNSCDVKDEF